MTRILSSAVRPIRLSSTQALRLGALENAHAPCARLLQQRAATTYTRSSPVATPRKPSPVATPRKPIPQTPYKRSATTTTTAASSSSGAAKPTTSAYAENQVNPVAPTAYVPPPDVGRIPELSPSPSSDSNNHNFAANNGIDWSSSFHGLSTTPFSPEVAAVLMRAIPFEDVEIKPDGIIYLPEIKYRRILNQAFGPGGWGMAPRGELSVGEKVVTREYALLVHGR